MGLYEQYVVNVQCPSNLLAQEKRKHWEMRVVFDVRCV